MSRADDDAYLGPIVLCQFIEPSIAYANCYLASVHVDPRGVTRLIFDSRPIRTEDIVA